MSARAGRLDAVLAQISQRPGTVQPEPGAVDAARRILENSGNRGSMAIRCAPAEIQYVYDGGRRYFVAVYMYGDVIGDAECSCGSASVCEHLLAVLATHKYPLG